MATYKPKGYKDYKAAQQLLDSVPGEGDFNPYDYIDQSYYRNTARGRMAYQEDLAKLLYMAQIRQEERMNEYNSPQEQVERMREAGLNPDLQGISSEPAANVAGYQGNPMDGTPTTLQSAGDVFGIISTVTSMVTGLASGISGISLAGVQKLGASISSASALFDLFDKSTLSDDGISSNTFLSDLLPHLSHRDLKKIQRARSTYTLSSRGKANINKALTEKLLSQGDFNRYSLDPKYSDDEENYTLAWQPFIDALADASLKELYSKSKKSEYDSSYYSDDKADSDLSFENDQRELFRQFKKPLSDVMSNFDKMIKNPELRAICKAALAGFILNILPL